MDIRKLHHYVPQFYLRRFTDASGRLWLFDKATQEVFQASPQRVAAETYFYLIPELMREGRDPLVLEKGLAALEAVIAQLTERWLTSVPELDPAERVELTDNERYDMSTHVSLQFLRTAEQREVLAAFTAQEGASSTDVTADEQRSLHTTLLGSPLVDEFASRIYESVWIFGYNTSGTPFLTSDNPVCVKTPDNRMWLKAPGVLSPETYFVFPLSPMLVLYCYEPEHWAAFKRLDGCRSPAPFSREEVEHENSGQVFMASRFVISNCGDFNFAQEFLPSIGTDAYPPPLDQEIEDDGGEVQ